MFALIAKAVQLSAGFTSPIVLEDPVSGLKRFLRAIVATCLLLTAPYCSLIFCRCLACSARRPVWLEFRCRSTILEYKI